MLSITPKRFFSSPPLEGGLYNGVSDFMGAAIVPLKNGGLCVLSILFYSAYYANF